MVSCAKVLLSESKQLVCKIRNALIGVPNKVSVIGLCDVEKGVIECIWLNLRYGLERTGVTKK